MGRFSGKVVLVTGSSSGIGAAAARAFDSEGASVVVNSSSSPEAGKAVATALVDGRYLQADIADPAACARLVEDAVSWKGRLDVLVNNAGVTKVIPHRDLDAVSDEIFSRILEVNLLGTFRMIRLSVPHLRVTAGCIVNVTSVAGLRPTGSSVPYAVSKAALNHLTGLVANVTGPDVRVNAVAPGLVRTPWTAGWDELHAGMEHRAPAGRSAEPEEIASVILAVAASSYMTGEVVVVDGGLSLR